MSSTTIVKPPRDSRPAGESGPAEASTRGRRRVLTYVLAAGAVGATAVTVGIAANQNGQAPAAPADNLDAGKNATGAPAPGAAPTVAEVPVVVRYPSSQVCATGKTMAERLLGSAVDFQCYPPDADSEVSFVAATGEGGHSLGVGINGPTSNRPFSSFSGGEKFTAGGLDGFCDDSEAALNLGDNYTLVTSTDPGTGQCEGQAAFAAQVLETMGLVNQAK